MFEPNNPFAVSPLEEVVINLLPVPSHPNTTFNDDALRAAVARSVSLDAMEKATVLKHVPEFTQEQIDAVFAIFAEEAAAFGALMVKHEAETRGEEEAQHRRASFHVLPGGRA